MLQLRAWKIALVVAAALFGLLFTLPNLAPAGSLPGWLGKRLNLGLDLQGGSYLLLEVDTAALRTETLNNLVEDVRRDLQTAGIAFTALGQANGRAQARITDPSKVDAALDKLQHLNASDAAGTRPYTLQRGPDQTVVFVPNPGAQTAAAGRAVEQSIEIIRRRIDQLGTREPTILRQGTNRIVVQAPGESDPEKLKRVIGQTAKLTFQMVDETATPEDLAAGRIPPGSVLLPSTQAYEPQGVVVKKRVDVAGEMLTNAKVAYDPQTGRPVVSFSFNGQGTRRFAEVSTQNVHKRFAIVLDNKVISDPTIQEPITGGSGQISGSYTEESASELAVLLRAGALPTRLNFIEQRTVGAELGADAVRAGAISMAIGAAAIFVFIILAYGLFGLFAAAALVVNVLMIIALMSLTQATLTLPGIAGIILTLAVAVDANVLIYERIRDEARAGRTVLASLDMGFRRAIVSIVDANITTLIAAIIMFQFGAGAVRGFAWTLSVGVLTSVFTALFITQVLIGWWFRSTRPKTLPI